MGFGPVGTGAGQHEPFDVTISWVNGASRQSTGFSLRKMANLTASAAVVAQHVADNFLMPLRGILPTTATVLGIDVVQPLTKEGASWAPATTLIGNSGATFLPGFVTAVFALKGSFRARYGNGRMMIPVCLEAWVDFETINAAGMTQLDVVRQALVDNYIDPTGVGQFSLINWHRLLPANRQKPGKPVLEEVPARWYDVTSVRINPQVTSLKSRKQGVGS